jgi:hypothetical protein
MRFVAYCGLAVALSGCDALKYDYAFDARSFNQSIGDDKSMAKLPMVACTPGNSPDPCAAVASQLPPGSGTIACDAGLKQCVATTEISLVQPVDLSKAQTPLPDAVLQFGINKVEIEQIAYWMTNNTLNVTTPQVNLYVAAQSAKDIHDPTAVALGSVAPLPAKSQACADPVDPKGDAAAAGQRVCDVPLTEAGKTALAGLAKNYKTPFNLIIDATLMAKGGEPLPAGSLGLTVRPTIAIYILR